MPLLAVPNFPIEWRQKVERYVGWLKSLWVRVGDVVRQRSKRAGSRRRNRGLARSQRRRVNSRHESGSNRFHISFNSANLSRKKYFRMLFHLQCFQEQRRRVDVSVAMDLPIAQEARVFESRNQPQNARLLAKFQMILESAQVVGI